MTQDEFNEQFISTTEICRFLSVTRATISNAKKNSKLPGAIETTNGYFWNRSEIMPYLEEWKRALEFGRHAKVQ